SHAASDPLSLHDALPILQSGGGYDRVIVTNSEAAAPKCGEIKVRLHASSLNYHDFAVVSGMWGPTEDRIPMADGAGEVIAVGERSEEHTSELQSRFDLVC